MMPIVEQMVYGSKLPKRLLAAPREELVQIESSNVLALG